MAEHDAPGDLPDGEADEDPLAAEALDGEDAAGGPEVPRRSGDRQE